MLNAMLIHIEGQAFKS